jgi:hypothetical protein
MFTANHSRQGSLDLVQSVIMQDKSQVLEKKDLLTLLKDRQEVRGDAE